MDLNEIRVSIDAIDEELVKLLEKRMGLVSQVAAYKQETGKPIFDEAREVAVIEKATNRVENEAYKETIAATFSDMMARSREYQASVIKK